MTERNTAAVIEVGDDTTAADGEEFLSDIRDLAQFYEDGLLTEEELEKERRRCLRPAKGEIVRDSVWF